MRIIFNAQLKGDDMSIFPHPLRSLDDILYESKMTGGTPLMITIYGNEGQRRVNCDGCIIELPHIGLKNLDIGYEQHFSGKLLNQGYSNGDYVTLTLTQLQP